MTKQSEETCIDPIYLFLYYFYLFFSQFKTKLFFLL